MAVDRADDIGSQFPSDAADTAPLDPTRNRQQIDYSTGPEPVNVTQEPQEANDGGSAITQGILKVVGNDIYTIAAFEGGVEGILQSVAKPWYLRRSPFEGEFVGDFTYEYVTNTFRKKIKDDNLLTVFETIDPPYVLNSELVYVAEVNATEVELAPTLIETNYNAHKWKTLEEFRVVLVDVGDDHLVVIRLDDDGLTTSDQFNIAKPYKLQRTPWDGEQITLPDVGITLEYAYTDIDERTATIVAGGSGDVETQFIIQRYLVGDILTVFRPENGTGVTVAGEELAYMDNNESQRGWARKSVV